MRQTATKRIFFNRTDTILLSVVEMEPQLAKIWRKSFASKIYVVVRNHVYVDLNFNVDNLMPIRHWSFNDPEALEKPAHQLPIPESSGPTLGSLPCSLLSNLNLCCV